MTVFTWIILVVMFIGVGIVWYLVNNDKSGAVSCCGCGKCVATGECVFVKKKAEKPSTTA